MRIVVWNWGILVTCPLSTIKTGATTGTGKVAPYTKGAATQVAERKMKTKFSILIAALCIANAKADVVSTPYHILSQTRGFVQSDFIREEEGQRDRTLPYRVEHLAVYGIENVVEYSVHENVRLRGRYTRGRSKENSLGGRTYQTIATVGARVHEKFFDDTISVALQAEYLYRKRPDDESGGLPTHKGIRVTPIVYYNLNEHWNFRLLYEWERFENNITSKHTQESEFAFYVTPIVNDRLSFDIKVGGIDSLEGRADYQIFDNAYINAYLNTDAIYGFGFLYGF